MGVILRCNHMGISGARGLLWGTVQRHLEKGITMGWRHWCLMLLMLLACGAPGKPPETLTNETVEAGCGWCQYGAMGNSGCYWTIQWKGDMLVVQGDIPQDHQNHAPDGMCNVKRQVVVSGRVKSGQIYAKKFELLPIQDVPENPKFTPADLH